MAAAADAPPPAAVDLPLDQAMRLVSQTCRQLVPAADIDDVVQATFLVYWRKRRQVAQHPRPLAWFQRTAVLICKERRRSGQRRRFYERRQPMPARTEQGDAGEAFAKDELAAQVAEALAELPERYADILHRTYFLGHSRDHIAGQLQVAPGTVASWLHRGRQRLELILRRRGVTQAGLVAVSTGFGMQPASAASPAVASLAQLSANERVIALAEQALHTLFLKQVYWVGGAISAALLVVSSAVFGIAQLQAAVDAEPTVVVREATGPAAWSDPRSQHILRSYDPASQWSLLLDWPHLRHGLQQGGIGQWLASAEGQPLLREGERIWQAMTLYHRDAWPMHLSLDGGAFLMMFENRPTSSPDQLRMQRYLRVIHDPGEHITGYVAAMKRMYGDRFQQRSDPKRWSNGREYFSWDDKAFRFMTVYQRGSNQLQPADPFAWLTPPTQQKQSIPSSSCRFQVQAGPWLEVMRQLRDADNDYLKLAAIFPQWLTHDPRITVDLHVDKEAHISVDWNIDTAFFPAVQPAQKDWSALFPAESQLRISAHIDGSLADVVPPAVLDTLGFRMKKALEPLLSCVGGAVECSAVWPQTSTALPSQVRLLLGVRNRTRVHKFIEQLLGPSSDGRQWSIPGIPYVLVLGDKRLVIAETGQQAETMLAHQPKDQLADAITVQVALRSIAGQVQPHLLPGWPESGLSLAAFFNRRYTAAGLSQALLAAYKKAPQVKSIKKLLASQERYRQLGSLASWLQLSSGAEGDVLGQAASFYKQGQKAVLVLRLQEQWLITDAIDGPQAIWQVFDSASDAKRWLQDAGMTISLGGDITDLFPLPLSVYHRQGEVLPSRFLPKPDRLVTLLPEVWNCSVKRVGQQTIIHEQGLPLFSVVGALAVAAVGTDGLDDLIAGHYLAYDAKHAETIARRHGPRIQAMQAFAKSLRAHVAGRQHKPLDVLSPAQAIDRGLLTVEQLQLIAGGNRALSKRKDQALVGRWTEFGHNMHMLSRDQPEDWIRGTLEHEWYRLWTVPLEPGWNMVLSRYGATVQVMSLPMTSKPTEKQLEDRVLKPEPQQQEPQGVNEEF